MNQKPSDLLLGVIDFFGVLIPGAILTLLHSDRLLGPLGLSIGPSQTLADWIPAFFVSYGLGHFLLSFSEFFNKLAVRYPSKETKAYYQVVRERIKLPPNTPDNSTNIFHSAFSFIRIHSPDAMVELERQAAEYKLFRSLTLLFLFDILVTFTSESFSQERLQISVLIVGLVAFRFWRLFDWTYKLAFDFYLQVRESVTEDNAA